MTPISRQLAAAQGQRIYQITPANMSSTLPMLNLDAATETEIFNAVNVGKEVISHTDLVSVPGFTGAGYIILDPETGEGAYLISGGGNGAFLVLIGFFLLAAILYGPAIAYVAAISYVFGGLPAVAASLSLMAAGLLAQAAEKMSPGFYKSLVEGWASYELNVAGVYSKIVRILVSIAKILDLFS